MIIEWIQLQRPEHGIEAQWQARVRGRSVAVLAAKACEHPRCDCPTHCGRGERRDVTDCEAVRRWRGILVGPGGVVVDIELERRDGTIVADEAKKEAEVGLRELGWGI